MKKTLIALMLVALALPVMAAEDGASPADRAQERVARFLELSAEQVVEWQALADARAAAIEPLQEEIGAAAGELRQQFEGGDPDPLTVGELTINIHDLRQQVGDAHRSYVEGFEDLLDDSQAGRYGFIKRADRAQSLLPSFRAVGLLPRD
jgi:hypothetical protein